jgi:HTH-type transcriptional regulator / antitoxin HigA
MTAEALKTEEDYQKALSRLEEIFHSPADTPEGDEAELLVLLIEKFEEKHYPIDSPSSSKNNKS